MTNVTSFVARNRIRPIKAWRSMQVLINDPEATGEVFKIIDALKGKSIEKAVARMKKEPGAVELLDRKPEILPLLKDREHLRTLPEGTLARAYLHFVESEDLSADGLLDASAEAPRVTVRNEEEAWLSERLRDIHDLWHVLTGYGRDPLGELCLLSFSHAQTQNRGVGFIVKMAVRNSRGEPHHHAVKAAVEEGRTHGRQATWLPGVHWEEMLARPIAELRTELNIGVPHRYHELPKDPSDNKADSTAAA